MWDTETHGKPAGRFGRSPLDSGADEETRRVLGPSNVAPDAAAHLEEAWRKMRAAAVSTRQHHRAEGAAVLDAFDGYGLERKGPALGYASVKQSTQERIYLYGPRADWNPDGAC